MSELITRRTFLKTTGAAALVAAAGSMLVGCGGWSVCFHSRESGCPSHR